MNPKAAKGLRFGCAVLALCFVALAGGGAWLSRNMTRQFAAVDASEQELIAAHGLPGDWLPAAGLVPDDERVAAFLQVRRETAEWRAQLERSVAGWRLIQETPNPLFRTVRSLRAANGASTVLAGFWTARNEALLAAGMGPGEYAWLYHLVYHAWLGHDPADGAGPVDVGFGRGAGAGRPASAEDVAEIGREARDRIEPMLVNASGGEEASEAWRREELARLAAAPERWPWQTDLPAAVAAAFASRETELAAAWCAATNPLELLFEASERSAGE